ncbi:MAG: hypothetical protein HXS44_02945 [Theionarchaea archaeon]|nr:hypothetical protein [Theionarchaea archaeon]
MSTLILMVVVPLLNAFLLSVTAVPRTVEHVTLMRIRNILSISGMTVLSLLLLSCAPAILSGNSYTYHLGGWSPFLGITLQLDALSFAVASVSVLVCFLALFYSIPHMGYMRRVGKYDAFFFLMVTGIMGVLLTRDLFNMYVFSEILNISIYVLITANEQKESYTASIKYLILGSLSSALFLLSVGLVYRTTGSLNMDYAREGLRILVQENPSLAYLIFSLFFVSLGVKAGIFPLHFWLPDAHSIAPSPISAVLSGIVLKISLYALVRIISLFDSDFYVNVSPFIAYTGAVAAIAGALLALTQKDIKRMLAYSSISQIGIIVIGLGIGTELAMKGALFHVINHALMKGGLFLCAGIIAGQSGTREILRLRRGTPGIAVCFVIFAMGVAGIPPLNGFVSKILICWGAVNTYDWLIGVILLASLLSCGYYFRVVQQFFGEKKVRKKRKNPTFRVSKALSFPVYILAVLCVILGLFPLLGLGLVEIALRVVGG